VLAAVAGSAALGVRLVGADKHGGARLVEPVRDPDDVVVSERPEATIEPSLEHYFVVTERNVFEPLVSVPREDAALAIPSDMPSPTGTSRAPSTPPRRDPTVDLAMTGVVESSVGLMALIKDIRRDTSVYAGVGGEAFGLHVAAIEAKRVTLAQGEQTYTIELGAKEIPDEGAEARRASSSRPSGTAASTGPKQSGGGPGPGFRRPGFGPGGGKGAFGKMSPEQWMALKSMSPEQVKAFKSKFAGGKGSGGALPSENPPTRKPGG
jgi:hypothetical protein